MVRNHDRQSRDLTPIFTNTILQNLGDTVRDDWLRQNLMSKFTSPDPRALKLREEKALHKWLSVEEGNRKTNVRLYMADYPVIGGVEVERVIRRARRTVARLLWTDVTPLKVVRPYTENILELLTGSFSGGSTTSKRRELGMVARKFSQKPDVTREAWELFQEYYFPGDAWLHYNGSITEPRIVDHNVMFFVPKNDTIERTCAKEPDLNSFMQKSIGDFIRRQLLTVGVNLNDQSVNRRYARQGSIDGRLATLDLSSASDSVTTQLICALLPPGWFCVLDALRCKRTKLPDGTIHENEMFSSMGNGFTFELESLIFYAIAKAVDVETKTHSVVSVYGDDIIVDKRIARVLSQVLGFCGFRVNLDKSFIKGRFRESCGGHYHLGVDVTPFYIRKPITAIQDVIHVLNSLRKWTSRGTAWCDPSWYSVWSTLAKFVPDKRLFGGYDLDSKETVASAEGQACRYMQVRKVKQLVEFETGSYLEWLYNASFAGSTSHFGSSDRFQDERRDHIKSLSAKMSLQSGKVISTAEALGRYLSSANYETRDQHAQVVELPIYKVVRQRKRMAYTFGMYAPEFPQERATADLD